MPLSDSTVLRNRQLSGTWCADWKVDRGCKRRLGLDGQTGAYDVFSWRYHANDLMLHASSRQPA